ncbi:LuxR family transcriptional regulator [Shigella flexneri 2a]|nr:LuxR family transcriptional regulator [Shigella flexneri 2a]
MQIVMFDRQSIFIHGIKISLQQRIPGVSIQGVSQADEGNDSNLLIVFYVQIMPDDLVMQLHRF